MAASPVDGPDAPRHQQAALARALPNDVRGGSIVVDEDGYSVGPSGPVALVSAEEAVQAAVAAGFWSVVSAELETENGYLVWALEIRDTQGGAGSVIIDAGNGRLLAFDSS